MQRVTVFTVLLMWASIWGTISHLFSVSNLALKSLSGRSLLKVVDWQKSTGSFHVMTLDEVRQANFSIERETTLVQMDLEFSFLSFCSLVVVHGVERMYAQLVCHLMKAGSMLQSNLEVHYYSIDVQQAGSCFAPYLLFFAGGGAIVMGYLVEL